MSFLPRGIIDDVGILENRLPCRAAVPAGVLAVACGGGRCSALPWEKTDDFTEFTFVSI
jgi:hypothetical protein